MARCVAGGLVGGGVVAANVGLVRADVSRRPAADSADALPYAAIG